MRSNEELMKGILERKAVYQAQKQIRHLAIAGAGLSVLLIAALIFVPSIRSGTSQVSQKATDLGATILGPEAGGYVIVALLAFALGIIVASAIRKKKE